MIGDIVLYKVNFVWTGCQQYIQFLYAVLIVSVYGSSH